MLEETSKRQGGARVASHILTATITAEGAGCQCPLTILIRIIIIIIMNIARLGTAWLKNKANCVFSFLSVYVTAEVFIP